MSQKWFCFFLHCSNIWFILSSDWISSPRELKGLDDGCISLLTWRSFGSRFLCESSGLHNLHLQTTISLQQAYFNITWIIINISITIVTHSHSQTLLLLNVGCMVHTHYLILIHFLTHETTQIFLL